MPEDNFLECMEAIAKTMSGTNSVGKWYGKYLFYFNKCLRLNLAAILNKNVQF